MIAVDNKDLRARILFKLLELRRKAFVRFNLAIFGQVARNEDIFQALFPDILRHRGKCRVYKPASLRELLALDPAKFAECLPSLLIVFRRHKRSRIIVRVRHYPNRQRRRLHCACKRAKRHCYRDEHDRQNDSQRPLQMFLHDSPPLWAKVPASAVPVCPPVLSLRSILIQGIL